MEKNAPIVKSGINLMGTYANNGAQIDGRDQWTYNIVNNVLNIIFLTPQIDKGANCQILVCSTRQYQNLVGAMTAQLIPYQHRIIKVVFQIYVVNEKLLRMIYVHTVLIIIFQKEQ